MAKQTTQQVKINFEVDNKAAKGSIKQLAGELKKTRNAAEKALPGSKEFNEFSAHANKLRAQLKAVKGNMLEMGQAGSKAVKKVSSTASKMGNAFKSLMGALLPMLAISKVIEFTMALVGLEKEFKKLNKEVSRLTGLTGKQLDNAIIKVQALGKTFDKETTEINQAANSLSKEMGVSFTDALGLIEDGMLAGADMSGDFLEQIKEYAPQFAAAEFSAKEFVNQLAVASREGILSDKGADAVKEGFLKIAEGTKATKDALSNAFGAEFSKKLFDDFNSGAISSGDAIKLVSEQMNRTDVSASKLQAVVADVFGGAGEDAGIRYLKSLKDIGSASNNVLDATDKFAQSQRRLLNLEQELAGVQKELTDEFSGSSGFIDSLTAKVKILGTAGLLKLVRFFKDLAANSKPIIDIFDDLSKEFNIVFKDIKRIAQGLGLFNDDVDFTAKIIDALAFALTILVIPIKQLIIFVKSAASNFIELWNSSETVRGSLAGMANAIFVIADNIKNSLIKEMNGLLKIMESIMSLDFTQMEAGLKEMGEGVKLATIDIGKGAGDAFQQGFEDAADKLIPDDVIENTKKEVASLNDDLDKETEKREADRLKKESEALKKLQAMKATAAAEEKKKQDEKFESDLKKKKDAEDAAARAIEDLKIMAIADGFERQKQQAELDFTRKIEALQGSESQILEQKKLLEAQRDVELRALELERSNVAKAEDFENILIEEELEKERVEQAFLQGLSKEQERRDMLTSIRKDSINKQLAILKDANRLESVEALKLQNELIKLDKDGAAKRKDTASKELKFKRELKEAEALALNAFADLAIEILGADEDARRKNAELLKALTIGKIFVNTHLEVSGHLASLDSTSTAGITGGLRAAAAIARAAISIAKVQAQKFEAGGFTLPSVSGGGFVSSPTLATFGEAGAEWVAPNSIVSDPNLRPIINFLEGSRQGYQEGGFTGEQPTPAEIAPDELINEIKALRGDVNKWNENFEVNLNVLSLEEKINAIKDVRLKSKI